MRQGERAGLHDLSMRSDGVQSYMKVRHANWDKKTITVSMVSGNVVELKTIDMRGHPMTLLGMFAAMDDETKKRAMEEGWTNSCVLNSNGKGDHNGYR